MADRRQVQSKDVLDFTDPEIKQHVKTLYCKVGAANLAQAAFITREAGLF
jgi:hypothetical protein